MELGINLLFLAVILSLLAGAAASTTSYDLSIEGNSAEMNLTLEILPENTDLTEMRPISWRLPEGTEIDSITDSSGSVDFSRDGSLVTFKTEIPAEQDREVVEIKGEIQDVVKEQYRELDLARLQLSARNDTTQVQVSTDRMILSEASSFGFDTALGNDSANYSGKGPVNLRLAISDAGTMYENYALFGPGNISVADDLYWVPAAVTGFLPQVNRHPVVVLPDREYNETVDRWSAGQYRTGGLIFIRNTTLQGDRVTGVLLHEVMHAFNAEALAWSEADRAWFDEGTSKYVEWLVNEKGGVKTAEIFGQPVTWRQGISRYTLPPRKTPEHLWQYYQEGHDFMERWKVTDARVDRTFGYAFSELVIRDYVRNKGAAALRPVYSEFLDLNTERKHPVRDVEKSNDRILSIMGTDLQPCKAGSKEVVGDCLDKVNGMEPEIPALGELKGETRTVEITPIQQPEADPVLDGLDPGNVTDIGFWKSLVSQLSRMLQQSITYLGGLLD